MSSTVITLTDRSAAMALPSDFGWNFRRVEDWQCADVTFALFSLQGVDGCIMSQQFWLIFRRFFHFFRVGRRKSRSKCQIRRNFLNLGQWQPQNRSVAPYPRTSPRNSPASQTPCFKAFSQNPPLLPRSSPASPPASPPLLPAPIFCCFAEIHQNRSKVPKTAKTCKIPQNLTKSAERPKKRSFRLTRNETMGGPGKN